MGFGTCGTCKCDRCARNAELSLEYTTLGEIQDVALVCFFCDECRHWSGNPPPKEPVAAQLHRLSRGHKKHRTAHTVGAVKT